ncbi:aldose epimerase family protein [Photobacterium gaetbulicola]|uniref:aldose epimerase family protein n=1 Tax=Photobacterium gaetbulicola TaxID=1295392 RepID=UPI00068E25F0|nr:aldose epimerase family protein [Photobacterium gaetbulicola]
MRIEHSPFGTFYNSKVKQITLANDNGMSVSILQLGGIITHLYVPNVNGEIADVVLGLDNLAAYTLDTHYIGALIGRVANRIEGAKFELEGETINIDGNAYQGKHCVHGGRFGYHRRIWEEVETQHNDNDISVTLRLLDADGEEGFRHNVNVLATYTLDNNNILTLKFNANTDGITPVNLTAHSYFNLYGHQAGSIGEHTLTIFTDALLEQKEDRLPNGNIIPLKTPELCFQKPKRLSADLIKGVEVNHSYVFTTVDDESTQLNKMARLEGDGRVLTVYSNEKTLHFYNGHNLDGVDGKDNARYPKYAGLCLEPKGYVNAINEPSFPCTTITPSKHYEHTIIYDFNQ